RRRGRPARLGRPARPPAAGSAAPVRSRLSRRQTPGALMPHLTTRDVPVEIPHTTLLFIDVQNFCIERTGGEYAGLSAAELDAKHGYFLREMETRVIPNMQRLQAGARKAGIEVMYTLIRNLTRDGRDRSLDYKITGFNVPPDSWDGQVIDAIKPGEDEMVIPKTSSNVFVSTN